MAHPVSSRPTAGVAMCVYNGARFLRQQLDSIAEQTERPAAMVIQDDGSTDGAFEVAQAWAAQAPFPVTVERNATRLGVAANFERAVSRLAQDVIFLADQDDLWMPEKVATVLDRFVAEPGIALLHTDADLVDDNGEPIGKTLFASLEITDDERRLVARGAAHEVYSRRNLVTGATCAFRRTLLAQAKPFAPGFLHDEWLAFVAAAVSRVAMLDEPVMAYRLHNANTVGIPLRGPFWRVTNVLRSFLSSTAERQRVRAERLQLVAERASALGADPAVIRYLDTAAAHSRFRSNLPRNPLTRLIRVLGERSKGHYAQWSTGRISVLHDLLIAR